MRMRYVSMQYGWGGWGLCCTDSCQWRSDVSHWAHVRDYVRNWTEHSIMSRFLARLTNSVNVFSISNMLQQTVTGSKPCVGSRDGGNGAGLCNCPFRGTSFPFGTRDPLV